MQRGVQVTQAFRNEIGKAVKTKRLTTGRTQKAFALEVGTTATTIRNIEMGLSLVSPPLLKRVVDHLYNLMHRIACNGFRSAFL